MFWWQASQIYELAVNSAKRTCNRCDVQFLDFTVVLKRWRFRRGSNGKIVIERHYQFEFTPDGDSRYQGQVNTISNRISAVILEPYAEN